MTTLFRRNYSPRHRLVLLACSLAIFIGAASTTQAQCPTIDNVGWGQRATVRFLLDGNLTDEQRRQIRLAVAEWNGANSINNSRVRFEEDFTSQNFQFRFLNGSLGGNTPAFASKQFTPDGTVVSATLTYDPNATAPGSTTLIADPSKPGYDTFIIKLTLHEMGHTMGLDHPPVTGNICDQQDGATVMNYVCGVNDQGNNLPATVTACDQNAINSESRYPPLTPTSAPRLIWQHQGNGLIGEWLMNGTSLSQSLFFTPNQVSDTTWKIVGVGDFNADGQRDLVWQNQASGQIGVWLMNGTTLVQAPFFTPAQVADTNWRIVGVADFNSDSRPDLVWQHQANGLIGVWLMNGTSLVQSLFFTPSQVSDTSWKIVGVADFNRDGNPDLIWQNQADGQIGVWLMNGTNLAQVQFFTPSQVSETNWKIRGAVDFNADNQPDLVWQNQADGQIGVWLMNGTSLVQAPLFSPSQVSDTGWKIVAVQP